VVCACGQPPALRSEGPRPHPRRRGRAATALAASGEPENIRTVDLRSTLLTDPLVVEGGQEGIAGMRGDQCGLQDPKYVDSPSTGRDAVSLVGAPQTVEGIYGAYAYSVQKDGCNRCSGWSATTCPLGARPPTIWVTCS